MLTRRVHVSLLAVQVVSIVTLLRSIAYDRWITVLMSVLLLAGATAAHRGRSWGIGLALASAVWFPVAWAIGIAPAWFCLVGLVGAWPFALTTRAFVRFDKGATALLAALAGGAGVAVALAWKHLVWSVVAAFPSLMPGIEAQHGELVMAVALLAALAARSEMRAAAAGGMRLRAFVPARVADVSDRSTVADAAEDELDAEEPELASRRAARRS